MSGPLDTTVSGPEMLSVSISFVALVVGGGKEWKGRQGEAASLSMPPAGKMLHRVKSHPVPHSRRRGVGVDGTMSPLSHCLGQRSSVLEGLIAANMDKKAAGAKTCPGLGGEVSLMAGWFGFPRGKSRCPASELTSLPF